MTITVMPGKENLKTTWQRYYGQLPTKTKNKNSEHQEDGRERDREEERDHYSPATLAEKVPRDGDSTSC